MALCLDYITSSTILRVEQITSEVHTNSYAAQNYNVVPLVKDINHISKDPSQTDQEIAVPNAISLPERGIIEQNTRESLQKLEYISSPGESLESTAKSASSVEVASVVTDLSRSTMDLIISEIKTPPRTRVLLVEDNRINMKVDRLNICLIVFADTLDLGELYEAL